MLKNIKLFNLFKYYKKILIFSFIFFLIISTGFLLGNHFSWEGKKGFYLEESKTFYTYLKKKILCSKTCKSVRFKFK